MNIKEVRNFHSPKTLSIPAVAVSCLAWLTLNSTAANAANDPAPVKANPPVINSYFFIQPIQVCDDSGKTCADVPTDTEKIVTAVYKQAGILPIFVPAIKANNNDLQKDKLETQRINLLDKARTIKDFPHSLVEPNAEYKRSSIIPAFFVNNLAPQNGESTIYGNAWVDGNGLVINAGALKNTGEDPKHIDVLAHEIGHNLGLKHYEGTPNNLMKEGPKRTIPSSVNDITPNGKKLSQLTDDQKKSIKEKTIIRTIPNVTLKYDDIPAPQGWNSTFSLNFNDLSGDNLLKRFVIDITNSNLYFGKKDGTLSDSDFTYLNVTGDSVKDKKIAAQKLYVEFVNGLKNNGNLSVAVNLYTQDSGGRKMEPVPNNKETEFDKGSTTFTFNNNLQVNSRFENGQASSINGNNTYSYVGDAYDLKTQYLIPKGIEPSDPDSPSVPEPENNAAALLMGLGIFSFWRKKKKNQKFGVEAPSL